MIHFLPTSALRPGHVVATGAGLVQIVEPLRVSRSHGIAADGSECRYTRGVLVEPNGSAPVSWCHESGDPADGLPRWTVQANDLKRWAVYAEPIR